MTDDVPILIAGGGPVGLMLGLELDRLGVPALVIDQSDGAPAARANLVAARTMEFLRRLGLAAAVREAGLEADYPHDTAYRVTFTDEDLYRVKVPSAAGVRRGEVDEAQWPTPEPQHRVNQMYVEQILRAAAAEAQNLTVRRGVRLVACAQDDDGVAATVIDERTGAESVVRSQWLVGCDGTRSTVRRQLGLRYVGQAGIANVISLYFRSAELESLNDRPAWMTFTFTPHHVGAVTAIDGRRFWVSHHHFPPDIDPSRYSHRDLLLGSIGRPIDFEVVAATPWTARAMVASEYCVGRIFLAGDAAHDWVPAGGFGMNAGIGDAVDLAWKLAACHQGWGSRRLLDSFQIERRPLGETVAGAFGAISGSLFTIEDRLHVFDTGAAGQSARDSLRRRIPQIEAGVHQAVGLNFGYQYDPSPINVPDGSAKPQFSIGQYQPDARPGARMPHFRLASGTALFDELGPGFTLLRVGDAPLGGPLLQKGRETGVPIAELTVDAAAANHLCNARMVLVRPDQHVCWRGDNLPADCGRLIDIIRGAAGGPHH